MTRGIRLRLCMWLFVGCALGFADARAVRAEAAAADAQEPSEYRKLVARAVREFDAGNFPEARALFSRAHDVYPSARTHLGLGFTAFELRTYAISLEHLEQALASKVKPLDARLRKSAEDVLAQARDLIARVTLSISPNSGRVLVDGVPTALIGGKALVLEVGDHSVEVQASGYLPERRTLRIVGGEQLDLEVVLRKPEAATEPSTLKRTSTAPAQPAPDDQGAARSRAWYKSPWLWASVGVVLVAGGVTSFALLRNREAEPRDPTVTENTPSGGVLRALRSR